MIPGSKQLRGPGDEHAQGHWWNWESRGDPQSGLGAPRCYFVTRVHPRSPRLGGGAFLNTLITIRMFSTAGWRLKTSPPQPADRQTEDAGSRERHMSHSEGGRRKSVAPSRQAITFHPLCVITSLNLKKKKKQGEENRDCRFNQYCNPAVNHCLYEPVVGGGSAFIPLSDMGWGVGGFSCCSKHGNVTPST